MPCDAAAVVLNYCSPEATLRCVELLRAQEGVRLTVIVIDNASPDGSGRGLESSLSSLGDVIFHQSSVNAGYGVGNNLGIRVALQEFEPEWLIVSNPDVEVRDRAALRTLLGEARRIRATRDNRLAVVAPQIVTPRGHRQNPLRLEDMTRWDLRWARARYCWPGARQAYLRIQLRRHAEAPSAHESGSRYSASTSATRVFAVHGSFFCAHTAALEEAGLVPLFDERMFLHYEELVVARRLRAAGLSSYVLPGVRVHHTCDVSSQAAWGAAEKSRSIALAHSSMRHVLDWYY